MDPALLQYRGGVRSLGKKKLADGNEHELFYIARTPAEVSVLYGKLAAADKIEDVEKRVAMVNRLETQYIAASMCQDDGSPLLTEEQAAKVPLTLKRELRDLISLGSNALQDDLGNG